MSPKFVMITLGTWFVFMVFAIINAIIRQGVFSSFLSELRAHQLSTFTLMILFLMITYVVFRFTDISLSDNQAFFMGTVWLILTISFEFLAGHFVFGNPWEKLFADYNVFMGRIWILIPLTTFVAPYLIKKILE
jgi:hypothetical protein